MVQKMSFKDISYLELWQPFCLADRNHLCNFGRMYNEKQFCEIILNLDQWLRRKSPFKVVLIWSSGSAVVQQSVPICTILVEGIMRINTVKLFRIWVNGSEGNVV